MRIPKRKTTHFIPRFCLIEKKLDTDPLQPNPLVTADLPGDYVFDLVVNDGNSDSPPDRVIVHAFAANPPPNARAGSNQNARVGRAVILDGSGSFNATAVNLAFSWSFDSVPNGSAVTNDS